MYIRVRCYNFDYDYVSACRAGDKSFNIQYYNIIIAVDKLMCIITGRVLLLVSGRDRASSLRRELYRPWTSEWSIIVYTGDAETKRSDANITFTRIQTVAELSR